MARKKKPKRKAATRRKFGRPKKGTPNWRPLFIEALQAGLHVCDAAETSGVNQATPYVERQANAEFAAAWAKAQRIGLRALKAEAHRRAYFGTSKPVYQGGKLVGHIQEYSDGLMQFLIKGRDQRYRDSSRLAIGGDPDNPTPIPHASRDALTAADIAAAAALVGMAGLGVQADGRSQSVDSGTASP